MPPCDSHRASFAGRLRCFVMMAAVVFGVAVAVRVVHVWAFRGTRSSTCRSGTHAATTRGRSGSPAATGSAPTSSTRRRSTRISSACSTRWPVATCSSSASCRPRRRRRRVLLAQLPTSVLPTRRLVAGWAWPCTRRPSSSTPAAEDGARRLLRLPRAVDIEPPGDRPGARLGGARRDARRAEPDARERAGASGGRGRVGLTRTGRDATETGRGRRTRARGRPRMLRRGGGSVFASPGWPRAAAGRRAQLRGDGGFYLTTSQFGPNFFIGNNPAPTAPTCRCGPAAARRSSSGRTRPSWPNARSGARCRRAKSRVLDGPGLDFITSDPGAGWR